MQHTDCPGHPWPHQLSFVEGWRMVSQNKMLPVDLAEIMVKFMFSKQLPSQFLPIVVFSVVQGIQSELWRWIRQQRPGSSLRIEVAHCAGIRCWLPLRLHKTLRLCIQSVQPRRALRARAYRPPTRAFKAFSGPAHPHTSINPSTQLASLPLFHFSIIRCQFLTLLSNAHHWTSSSVLRPVRGQSLR